MPVINSFTNSSWLIVISFFAQRALSVKHRDFNLYVTIKRGATRLSFHGAKIAAYQRQTHD